MPFVLHPSGYCVWYNPSSKNNLIVGAPCPFCGRVAGHYQECELFKESDSQSKGSRAKLYNAVSVIWAKAKTVKMFTFTLPSRQNGTYQVSATDQETGDLAVTAKFSMLLESVAVRAKRAGQKFSYVWISEAQMKRQKKFGGIGDLHFHLVTDLFIDIAWIQNAWSNHVGFSKTSVDVQLIPKHVKSIPAYLVKYLGKGSQRYIYSRRFSCTRDLSAFVPVQLRAPPPELEPETERIITQKNGYETCLYFYNTSDVLELYGSLMQDEKRFNVKRTDKNFTETAILDRAHTRTLKRLNLWNTP